MRYIARTTVDTDGRTLIEFPDCPGCQTFADKDEDVAAVGQDALEGWLEANLIDGKAPPKPAYRKRGAHAISISVSPALAIALQVRWRRQELGLSQSALGKKLGVTRQQIALIEWPGGNLRISTLSKVAAALGARLEVDLTSVA